MSATLIPCGVSSVTPRGVSSVTPRDVSSVTPRRVSSVEHKTKMSACNEIFNKKSVDLRQWF